MSDTPSVLPVRTPEPEPCPACGGSGQIPLGEHFVTRNMALDACEPAMEGMSCGIEYGPCEECDGTGVRTTQEQHDG